MCNVNWKYIKKFSLYSWITINSFSLISYKYVLDMIQLIFLSLQIIWKRGRNSSSNWGKNVLNISGGGRWPPSPLNPSGVGGEGTPPPPLKPPLLLYLCHPEVDILNCIYHMYISMRASVCLYSRTYNKELS